MSNNHKEKLLTVGELARIGGVSVRTLQYYDKSGLLIPGVYSEGGRRMYGKHDTIRLQQILFLKSLRFSLNEIRDSLLPTESVDELERVFNRQKEVLVEQIARIREAVLQLDKVIDEIKSGNEIGMDKLFAIIGATQMGNPYSFMIRHISKDDMKYFLNCFENKEAVAEFNKISQALSKELIEIYRQHEDPEGSKAQQLASSWWEMMMVLTKNDPALLQKLIELGANDDIWPSETRDLKDAVKTFLGQAMITYLKNNQIIPSFMKESIK